MKIIVDDILAYKMDQKTLNNWNFDKAARMFNSKKPAKASKKKPS